MTSLYAPPPFVCSCSYPGCSGHGKCSPVNGSCVCETGWSGPACNTSLEDALDSLLEMRKATPTIVAPVPILATPTSSLKASRQALSPSTVHYQTSGNQLSNDSTIASSQTLGVQSLGNPPSLSGNKTHPPIVAEVSEGGSPQPPSHDPPLRDYPNILNDAPSGNSPTNPSDQSANSMDMPTQPPTECAAPPRTMVGVAIAVGLATVCIHVVLCFWTHRTLYRNLSDWYDKKVRSKLSRTPTKRRKRRKRKQYFVPLTQDSSSDCSI